MPIADTTTSIAASTTICELNESPQLKEFGKAESDADAALRVDPRHVKSLQRRAAARNALGKHRAALVDLQTAAEIDSTSKQVRTGGLLFGATDDALQFLF